MVVVAVLTVLLVAYNTATNLVAPLRRAYVARNVAAGALLVAVAMAEGIDASALGLGREELLEGWRWGRTVVLAAAVSVAAAAALAPVVPPLQRAFTDQRADLPPRALAYHTLLRIPIGTAAFEEIAFRGVLLALASVHLGTAGAVVWTSVAFGLWHIGPAIEAARINDRRQHVGREVATSVVATAVGGVGFALLRIGSDSLLAPALAHWGINALGLLAAAVFHRTGG